MTDFETFIVFVYTGGGGEKITQILARLTLLFNQKSRPTDTDKITENTENITTLTFQLTERKKTKNMKLSFGLEAGI